MTNLGELCTLYRIQAPGIISPCKNKDLPIKRVLISGVGQITFNPDSRQYVYFSRTDKHHVYYIFNKIFKMVAEDINKLKMADRFIAGRKEIILNDFYTKMNRQVLKDIKNFLNEYVPASCIELVSLTYLSSFYDFFIRCAGSNKNKQAEHVPEISDTHFYGGAFGVNDSWLDLLKCCTTESKSSVLYLCDFIDFIMENQQQFNSVRKSIKSYLVNNPKFQDILSFVRYKTFSNPDFFDKNNTNRIRSALTTILDENQFSPDIHLSRRDILNVKKDILSEMEFNR